MPRRQAWLLKISGAINNLMTALYAWLTGQPIYVPVLVLVPYYLDQTYLAVNLINSKGDCCCLIRRFHET